MWFPLHPDLDLLCFHQNCLAVYNKTHKTSFNTVYKTKEKKVLDVHFCLVGKTDYNFIKTAFNENFKVYKES